MEQFVQVEPVMESVPAEQVEQSVPGESAEQPAQAEKVAVLTPVDYSGEWAWRSLSYTSFRPNRRCLPRSR